ncbi:Translation factor guf1 mitochondrial [Entomophthora muscae]|uniref:Translation factor guf1 mitochondrial n=1 Tax=Entomophthora muscae TaxID=34485 RepID=A0ACC2UR99_9FUNG|nr:Translation factor guf1 mitochondrial [Entomophthora muscae]
MWQGSAYMRLTKWFLNSSKISHRNLRSQLLPSSSISLVHSGQHSLLKANLSSDRKFYSNVRVNLTEPSLSANAECKVEPSLEDRLMALEDFPPSRIRNFSIIAHIDHGKSTLADRLLELTGTINSRTVNKQVLDKLQVERERGITVKAQTVSMVYRHTDGHLYLLNLIDTPGHVDFSYEVSRSLAACQGGLLVVDACQGVQAQTVANFYLAFTQGLTILPIVNKVDLPAARPAEIANQIQALFELDSDDVIPISAKTGLNVQALLPRIVESIPPPQGDPTGPFRALLFDSWYDTYLGAICLVAVVDGQLQKGDRIVAMHSETRYEVLDLGVLHPNKVSHPALYCGQVGYLVLGMKTAAEAKVGDTFYRITKNQTIPKALPGFAPAKPMVFAGVFPISASEFTQLEEAIGRLTLNDASVSVQRETSLALGQGWRLGFLGTLHLDVFKQRLEEEHSSSIIVTSPTVPFKVQFLPNTKLPEIIVRTPSDFPDPAEYHNKVQAFLEPIVKATIIFPAEFMGPILELCMNYRGDTPDTTFLDSSRVMLRVNLPLAEIVTDFYDQLKSKSSGYASFDYEETGYAESDLVKMSVLLNSHPVDVLTQVLHRSRVAKAGRNLVVRLKDVIDRQLFEVTIQAAINKKIVARDTIPAMRKNVTAKCYGGDVSRKMKLLAKQKEGKKKLKMIGNIQVPHEAFLSVMKASDD